FAVHRHRLCDDLDTEVFFDSDSGSGLWIFRFIILSAGGKEKKGNEGEESKFGTHEEERKRGEIVTHSKERRINKSCKMW
ncbi:MAG: hypothetical protein Greene041662_813, partial [Candidatus Peregrinibacteria bacterium Greene0416_62]